MRGGGFVMRVVAAALAPRAMLGAVVRQRTDGDVVGPLALPEGGGRAGSRVDAIAMTEVGR